MRYAIYYVPDDGTPLQQAAEDWFAATTLPDDVLAAPRHYGFHATLKPPMRLAEGFGADELDRAVAAFCQSYRPVRLGPLKVTPIGPFLALTPDEPAEAVNALAADVVAEFDRFRAPMDDKELARRDKPGLSDRERQNLRQWGYPYVFGEFRFHMSLTGPLSADQLVKIEDMATRHFAQALASPFIIGGLAIFVENDADAPMTIWRRHAFAQGA